MEEAVHYSIAKMLAAMLFINIVVCLTFAVPVEIGFPILTFFSLIVLPPAIIVGIVNTRGARQAFFLGCMCAGMAHFVASVYIAIYYAFEPSGINNQLDEAPLCYIHLIGYTIGLIGGISGVGMYYLITLGQSEKPSGKKLSGLKVPEDFHEEAVEEDREPDRAPIPR